MKPTPTNMRLDPTLVQLMTTRPEVGVFVRKVYDLVAETGVNGKGFSIVLVGDELVVRLQLR